MFNTVAKGRNRSPWTSRFPLAVASAALSVVPPARAVADIIPLYSSLDAMQETTPNASPGTGFGTLSIDTNLNTLTFHIEYASLTSTESGAGIYGPTEPGVEGLVLYSLTAGSPKDAFIVYSEADEAAFLAGLTYINIGTSFFVAGEIRGQIISDPVALRKGNVDTGNGNLPANVLFVDGIVGDPVTRTMDVDANTLHSLFVDTAPSVTGKGWYGVWAFSGGLSDTAFTVTTVNVSSLSFIGLSPDCLPSNNRTIAESCPCPPMPNALSLTAPGLTSRNFGPVIAKVLCVNESPGYPRAPTQFSITIPAGTWTFAALVQNKNSVLSMGGKDVSIANWIVVNAL